MNTVYIFGFSPFMMHQVIEYQFNTFNSYILQLDLSYIYIYRYKSIIYGIMIHPHNNQLPFDMLVQLVDHCRDQGSNPGQTFLAQEKSGLTYNFPCMDIRSIVCLCYCSMNMVALIQANSFIHKILSLDI